MIIRVCRRSVKELIASSCRNVKELIGFLQGIDGFVCMIARLPGKLLHCDAFQMFGVWVQEIVTAVPV